MNILDACKVQTAYPRLYEDDRMGSGLRKKDLERSHVIYEESWNYLYWDLLITGSNSYFNTTINHSCYPNPSQTNILMLMQLALIP